VCNTARAVLAVRPTVLSEITDIGGNSAQHRCVERTVVRSVVAGINAAHRLRGDAVVTVMQTANFGNGNNATGRVHHDNVIEALASDRTDDSLHVGVLPW
jgi:hypothetical protein